MLTRDIYSQLVGIILGFAFAEDDALLLKNIDVYYKSKRTGKKFQLAC